MYERLSEAEILQIRARLDRKSRRPWAPLLIGLFVGLMIPAMEFLFGSEIYKPFEASPAVLGKIGVISFSVSFFVIYCIQLRKGRGFVDSSAHWICRACHKLTSEHSDLCSCGGLIEPSEYYRESSNSEV
jgi:hypothetical protein